MLVEISKESKIYKKAMAVKDWWEDEGKEEFADNAKNAVVALPAFLIITIPTSLISIASYFGGNALVDKFLKD